MVSLMFHIGYLKHINKIQEIVRLLHFYCDIFVSLQKRKKTTMFLINVQNLAD